MPTGKLLAQVGFEHSANVTIANGNEYIGNDGRRTPINSENIGSIRDMPQPVEINDDSPDAQIRQSHEGTRPQGQPLVRELPLIKTLTFGQMPKFNG